MNSVNSLPGVTFMTEHVRMILFKIKHNIYFDAEIQGWIVL